MFTAVLVIATAGFLITGVASAADARSEIESIYAQHSAAVQHVGAQARTGFGDIDDRVGQHGRLHFGGAPRKLDIGRDAVLLQVALGEPDGFGRNPRSLQIADLLTGTPAEIVIADKGFWGRGYRERLAADGTALLTPAKTRTADNLGRERALASTRLVIESVFSNLKGQMRLEQHLAKTPAGLAARIAQRILALTIGILLNTLTGRPARALAAYDGR